MELYFWFRKSTTKDTKGTISCVIRIDGIECVPFSTQIKTEKKLWNSKQQCFEGKGSAQKEAILSAFIARIDTIYKQLFREKNGEQIFPEEIRDLHVVGKRKIKKNPSSLKEVIKEFLKRQNELLAIGKKAKSTIQTYEVRINNIQKFLDEKNMNRILCKDFGDNEADEFQHWMLVGNHEQSYINNHIFFIKQIQKFAKKKKYINSIPLDDFEFERIKEKDPVVLEPTEIAKIKNFSFDRKLQLVVDAYLFCQETSLSYGDYMRLTSEMVTEDENGIFWIEKEREKTDIVQYIPLSEIAKEILQKYENSVEKLPRFSPSHANTKIKEIAKIVGIEKKLVWHSSRKTWANNSLNYKNMNGRTIASIMGWTSLAPLKKYARLNKAAISKDFFV